MYKLKYILKILIFIIFFFYIFLFLINYSHLLTSNVNENHGLKEVKSIKCFLQNQTIEHECLHKKNQNEVYVPYFSFLMKKFDLHGRFENDEFQLLYTYTKTHYPLKKYEFNDEFLWFKDVYVEARDRVKYMSGKYGVPVSSQWFPKGHIYPVQVAQYGLSYYSRWKSNQKAFKSKQIQLDDLLKWKFLKNNENSIQRKTENEIDFNLKNDKAVYQINEDVNSVFFFMTNIYTKDSISIIFNLDFYEYPEEKKISLVYEVNGDKHESETPVLSNKGSKVLVVKYFVNGYDAHFQLIRNIYVDVCKAVKSKECLVNYLYSTTHYKILNLNVMGVGVMKNPILTEDASFEIARQSADYLIASQDTKTGTWPMKVLRNFRKNDNLYLNTNWNSAMLQGHAMSLLSRLYYTTKNKEYLNSALKAVEIFNVNVSENGVRTYFLDKYIWYEEYPTKPNSLLVLNGFIYSLFGLYDLYNCLKEEGNEDFNIVYKLYQDGLYSLKNLITWFDTGSRTFYDLRHITNKEHSEPNMARWDYHVLHINLLLHLSTIHEDIKIFKTVANRWIKYTKGYWSEHN